MSKNTGQMMPLCHNPPQTLTPGDIALFSQVIHGESLRHYLQLCRLGKQHHKGEIWFRLTTVSSVDHFPWRTFPPLAE